MKFICILPLFCQNALNEHPELHASVWASELQGVERGSEVIAHLLQRSWGSSAEKLSIYCREVCDFLCSCFLLSAFDRWVCLVRLCRCGAGIGLHHSS